MNMKILFLIVIIFSSNCIISQERKLLSAPNGIVKNKNFKEIKLSERLSKLPFASATKVKIVSFNLEFNEDDFDLIPVGAQEMEKKKSINFRSDIIDNNLKNFDQIETLSFNQLNKLTDILYNTCSKYIISFHSTVGCYYPRNAILFYDKNDRVFEYLEICFECRQLKTKSAETNDFNEFCEIGLSELETFFKKNGIETEHRKK